nr:nucleoside-diphosphate sugar epimerase/dehydratase [uncultured Merdimonas sp.]
MDKWIRNPGWTWVQKAFLIAFLDILIILASYMMALILRFDFLFSRIPREYIEGYMWSMPYWIAATIVVFYGCRLYHSVWRLASISELQMSIVAYIILIPVYTAGMFFMKLQMPRSYYFVGYILSFMLTTGLRFSFRFLRFYVGKREGDAQAPERIMVIGAGSAGQVIIKELINNPAMHTKVCCVIDDNPNKWGRMLEGVPIVGDRNDILHAVEKYKINRIIYAIPATTGKNRKDILNICKETSCRLQTVPSVAQLVNGEVSVSRLRDVEITDLLGRAQVKVNNSEIFKVLKDKVVMVTGGGGSIGSELCRQIAKAYPKTLIIFDIYENNAYAIQQELKRQYPDLHLETLIGSVRNTNRVDSIIEQYHPDIIYHAAAHKHVPLMEDSPNEAIKNNVEGTYKVAQSAAKYGVRKFVLISTDKAVNPTNIMGASKRLCEMVVQMMNRLSPGTDFVAVRFGNVLGSNGSVIPLFKKQIAEGGPVTVTDKNIIRYFMTIPEAVSLVLQASYYAKGGEIFVLDMGEPVKIDDMARNLIRLSGYTPDVDIPIVYTGLRPGEKLYEELLMDEEGMQETDNELIFIGKPIEMDDEDFQKKLELLDRESKNESGRIKEIVAEIVPTYHPDLDR